MKDLARIANPYNEVKVIDACSIFGMMNTWGRRFSGKDTIAAIANMHDRGNGMGGGFGVYGLYPEYAEYYAFHIMFLSRQAKTQVEAFLNEKFHLLHGEEVPTRPVAAITDPPLVWRYFLEVKPPRGDGQAPDDYVVDRVMEINGIIEDAFVFSSGKDMAVFKGVGFPEEIAD
jgi:glutamate synthase domain-containing protein 1